MSGWAKTFAKWLSLTHRWGMCNIYRHTYTLVRTNELRAIEGSLLLFCSARIWDRNITRTVRPSRSHVTGRKNGRCFDGRKMVSQGCQNIKFLYSNHNGYVLCKDLILTQQYRIWKTGWLNTVKMTSVGNKLTLKFGRYKSSKKRSIDPKVSWPYISFLQVGPIPHRCLCEMYYTSKLE